MHLASYAWVLPLFALLAAGLFAGFTAGMFGVGGGFVVVPAMLVILPLLGGMKSEYTHVAIGTSAGSAGNSVLTVTGKASLSLDAVLAVTAAATPFKMSAAGQLSIAVATGPLTAGVIEAWVLYAVASND